MCAGMGGQDNWCQPSPFPYPSAPSAGGDPIRRRMGWCSTNPPTPPMFASCLVFPLPLGPLCKESSGTQTVMLDLSSTSPKTSSWGLMERREPQKHSRIRPGYKVKFVTVLVLKSKKTKKVIIGLCSSFSSSKTSRNIFLLIFLIPTVANCQQRSETQNPAHEHSVRSQPWPRTLPFHIPSCLPSALPPHPFPSTHCLPSKIPHGNNPTACFPWQVNTGFKAVCRPSHSD